jgi:hypothetical protein
MSVAVFSDSFLAQYGEEQGEDGVHQIKKDPG